MFSAKNIYLFYPFKDVNCANEVYFELKIHFSKKKVTLCGSLSICSGQSCCAFVHLYAKTKKTLSLVTLPAKANKRILCLYTDRKEASTVGYMTPPLLTKSSLGLHAYKNAWTQMHRNLTLIPTTMPLSLMTFGKRTPLSDFWYSVSWKKMTPPMFSDMELSTEKRRSRKLRRFSSVFSTFIFWKRFAMVPRTWNSHLRTCMTSPKYNPFSLYLKRVTLVLIIKL